MSATEKWVRQSPGGNKRELVFSVVAAGTTSGRGHRKALHKKRLRPKRSRQNLTVSERKRDKQHVSALRETKSSREGGGGRAIISDYGRAEKKGGGERKARVSGFLPR
jgi:hypothetical protein